MIGATDLGYSALPQEAAVRRQFVTFVLSHQVYGVDIMAVREIRMLQAVTTVPGTPDYVSGMINLRGSILPVYDLRRRFGEGTTTLSPNHAAVVVSIKGRLSGLLVDEVLDIVTVAASDVAAIANSDGACHNPFFEGLVTQEDSLLIIVDLERIIDGTGPVETEGTQ